LQKERNKKLIEWGLKLKSKNKEDNRVYYMSGETKEGKKNQTTTSDNPITVICHTPL
jgi:hypothetical protein